MSLAPVAPLKLGRCPTRSSLTLATLPSTSLVPFAPFTGLSKLWRQAAGDFRQLAGLLVGVVDPGDQNVFERQPSFFKLRGYCPDRCRFCAVGNRVRQRGTICNRSLPA
jgi:hypothetical protein